MDGPAKLQLSSDGKIRHFLTIEGLSRSQLVELLDIAEGFKSIHGQPVKKIPILRGKTVVNLFFENSTRTRTTFDIAAQRLSADLITIDIRTSSQSKGESLNDILKNLQSMQVDLFVVRHHSGGAAHFIAQRVDSTIAVINAGDGYHAHPTQALLDLMTMRQRAGDPSKLSVAIIGDIKHSRVARSLIHGLKGMQCTDIRIIGPPTLIPNNINTYGVSKYFDIKKGIKDVNVIVCLRLQTERMQSSLIPSANEFFKLFGITNERLKYAAKNVIIMHPGPINRGIEISDEVADGDSSVILNQVTNGIAVRMAVMAATLSNRTDSGE